MTDVIKKETTPEEWDQYYLRTGHLVMSDTWKACATDQKGDGIKINDILNDSEFDSYDAKIDAIIDLARNMELELKRLRAYVGANEFRSDYKSADHMREEIDRLRTELAAEKQANTELQLALGAKDYDFTEIRGELTAMKALLREADKIVEAHSRWFVGPHGDLHKRIRAALGDLE